MADPVPALRALVIVGLWIRLSVDESPMGARMAENVSYYVITAFLRRGRAPAALITVVAVARARETRDTDLTEAGEPAAEPTRVGAGA